MSKETNSSVLIVEDHLLFCEGLKTFLQNTQMFSKIAQAHNGLAAVQMVQEFNPDIVLMDIQLPEMDGLKASALIKQSNPKTKIIMLTSFTDEDCVKSALTAGAEGYCSKDINPTRLLSVIDMVSSGSIYLDPKVADFVLRHYFGARKDETYTEEMLQPPAHQVQHSNTVQNNGITHNASDKSEDYNPHPLPHISQYPLTGQVLKGRELEILALIANNQTHEEIANSLKISIDWVNSYVKSIVQKLSVADEWSAVKKAISDGALKKATSLT